MQQDQKIIQLKSLILTSAYFIKSNDSDIQAFFELQSVMVEQFLEQSDGSVETAFENFCEYIYARQKYVSDVIVNQKSIPNLLKLPLARIIGKNKLGKHCMVIKVRFFEKIITIQEKIHFIFYTIDQVVKKYSENNQPLCILWDREGFDPEIHQDQEFTNEIKQISEILLSYCSYSVDTVYVTNVSWLLRSLFEVAKKFSSRKLLKYVYLVDKPTHLLEFFGIDQLKLMGY